MYEILKLVHIASLMAGSAVAIGNGILMVQIKRAGGPPPPVAAATLGQIGNLGLPAIILLWLTGIPMALMEHGTLALGWMFYTKLAGATLVLAASTMMFRLRQKAQAAGTPPPFDTMMSLAKLAWVGLGLAVVFAVLVFG